MYFCTQGRLGSAQICRFFWVRKLWNKEKDEKRSAGREESNSFSTQLELPHLSLSDGWGHLTQRRTTHSLLLSKESVKTPPPAPMTFLEAKLRRGSPQAAAQLVLPGLPPLPS